VPQLKLLAARPQAALASASYQEWRTGDGEILATFHRRPEGCVVRYLDRADFFLTNGSELVCCMPIGGVSEQVIRFLFANQIVPLLQNRAGKLVLHASAVACSAHAFGFLGKSGRGKSTLAAAFARAGYPFLSDDGLVAERDGAGFLVWPSNPNLGLWHDSAAAVFGRRDPPSQENEREKLRIEASVESPFQTRPLGLRAIYVLGPGTVDSVAIEALAPAAAFSAMLQHAFILDIEDRVRMRLQWRQMGELAERVPCFALDYPRRYDALPAVLEAVIDHAGMGASAT
jgi:hypothetical protein